VDIYIFASLSGLQSRHGLHRQLVQHASTEASMCTAAYAQLVDEASTGERAPVSEHRRGNEYSKSKI
jgi:hypothetical protein